MLQLALALEPVHNVQLARKDARVAGSACVVQAVSYEQPVQALYPLAALRPETDVGPAGSGFELLVENLDCRMAA